jgi:UPF0042 nucleotide-binding protein
MNKLVIISGLSGSGKSTALNAVEDLDFYAVDNLPIKLFEKFLELLETSTEFNKVALVMDIRDREFVQNYPTIFRTALAKLRGVEILFLDASDEVLIRRFSETRRKHPLSNVGIAEGIAEERKLLSDLKDLATTIIDTSAMDVHALKKRIIAQYSATGSQQMQIRLVSFGFKYGTPKNCDLILDVRFLSNPHFVAELRETTGLDKSVQDFILKDPRAKEFLERTQSYLEFLIPQYAAEGKTYLTIGLGCTGGKHRSVFMAKTLGDHLKSRFGTIFPLSVEHQDLRLHA